MISKRLQYLLVSGAVTALSAGTGHAAITTPAGTIVANQAQASYTVNGTPQSVPSNTSTFVVDRKVDFTLVTTQNANTQVSVNQNDAVTTYRLTNLTNAPQDFILDPDQQNLSLGILPGSDNFDMQNLRAFVDANNNGTYEPDIDTASYIDQLPQDTSVNLLIVANVPNLTNANLAFVSMHATVADGDTPNTRGAPLVPTGLDILNRDATVDIVFADNDTDPDFAGDAVRNGQGRVYAAYEIGTLNVALTVTKSSRVVEDGVSALNPKALPGATIEYCLVVANGTPLVPASNVTLTDTIPANTTYVPGSIRVGGLGLAGTCLTGGIIEDDDVDDAAETDPYRGSFDTTAKKVTAVIPTLLGSTSLAASFQVTVN